MSSATNEGQEERILSVEEILDAPDTIEDVVYVPEWKGSVRVRSFTLEEQQTWRREATVNGEVDEDRIEVLMFIHGVVEPKFTADRAEQLRKKSAGAINRVNKRLLELSGLTKEASKAAEKSFPEGRA